MDLVKSQMFVITMMCIITVIRGNLMLYEQLLEEESEVFEDNFIYEGCNKRKTDCSDESSKKKKRRTLWSVVVALLARNPVPKSSHWFRMAMNDYNDVQFKEAFGIERSTFDFLDAALSPMFNRINQEGYFTRKGGKKALSFQLALAITVYRLTSTLNTRRIAQKFGVSKGMVSTLCKEVLRLICTYLKDRYISWPGEFEQTIINRAFFDKRGIPGIVGIMDGSHIPIQLLKKIQAADYYCRKGFYSINVQAIIDHNMLFRDIYVGWPGSCPDARVWRNSPFAIKAQREQELPQAERTLFYDNNFIIADAGYGLKPYLLVPFKEKPNMPFSRTLYNFAHSSTRMLVENAFARLKNRFALLGSRVNFKSEELICKAITAAMIIHNICIILNDEVLVERMGQEPDEPVLTFNAPVFGREPRASSKRGRIARQLLSKYRENPMFFARR